MVKFHQERTENGDEFIKVTQFFIDIAPKIPYIFGAMFKREINPTKTKSYFLCSISGYCRSK